MAEQLGPNVKRLVIRRASLILVPEGCQPIAAAASAVLNGPGLLEAFAAARLWVTKAIAAVKSAPDNPYGDDDEAIAGAILAKMRERFSSGRGGSAPPAPRARD
jgi:hypothetical protein